MKKEPLIKLEDVWRIYELGKVELTVLRGISLEINPGSFVVVMGPSGSGKSTLLHMLGYLDTPTKGKIFWRGKDVSNFSENELAELRGQSIGFVFQQFNLLPNLSALENVMLPMAFQGELMAGRKWLARKLLGSLGLEDRADHRPTELSGGEQQRVAIARSLANDPEVVLADEPTGNLDSKTGKMIMEILIDLHKKQGKTIIVITHDQNIARYSKEIINIADGQIIKNHQSAEKILW